jgi:hypothetical protein
MEEEPEPTLMNVTCRTEGCPVCNVTYVGIPMYANIVPPVWRAVCAQCGQTVTDIVPTVTA